MQNTVPDPAASQAMAMAMMPFIGIGILVFWAILIVPFWQIFKKAGMAGPLSLLMLIPLVNLIMLYVLAFSDWKVVPAPDYGAGYLPPAYPPGYVPPAPGYVPQASGYVPQAAAYPPATQSSGYPPPPPPPPPPSHV